MKDFKLGEIIGRGACGVVRVVSEKAPPNSVFAMKSQFKGSWLYHDPVRFITSRRLCLIFILLHLTRICLQ